MIGRIPDFAISADFKQAVQTALTNIIRHQVLTQGGYHIMQETKLAHEVVNKCPKKFKADVILSSKGAFSLSAPRPKPRDPVVSAAQERFLGGLPPLVKAEVQRYSHTFDCEQHGHPNERIIDGVLVNTLHDNETRLNVKDLNDLNKDYILNWAPRDKNGKLLKFYGQYPNASNLFNCRINNGACAPLAFYDDGNYDHKFTKMDRLIASTLHVVSLMEKAPILASRVFLKSEVAPHVKEDGAYKKIRAIQNASPETVMLYTLLFDKYMQCTSGLLNKDMMGVTLAHSPIQDIMMHWYMKNLKIFRKRGCHDFEEFLNYVDRMGADCSDQKSWEATTEKITALHLIFMLVSSLDDTYYNNNKGWITNLLANFLQPHSVLYQKGNKSIVVTKLGGTESGSKMTLYGNSKRHGCFSRLFFIKATRCYNQGNLFMDNVLLPELDNWEDELQLFINCEMFMGDDRFALRTAFSHVFHTWKDYYFGTVTKSVLTDTFFCRFDEHGMPNSSAEFLQLHFTRSGTTLKCQRPTPRLYAKLIFRPFELSVHALAATQMAMFNCCPEGYDQLKEFYDDLLSTIDVEDEKLQGELLDFWRADAEYSLYEQPTLVPPTQGIVDMYQRTNHSQMRLKNRMYHFIKYRQDLYVTHNPKVKQPNVNRDRF